jgi:prepilin-type N-terminal cleavage/methylation domain-containing protein
MLNQMFNEKRSKNGFTIVELVVVMTIMGILASSAVIAYNKVVNDAKATKSRDVVSALQQAKALFMLDPGTTRRMFLTSMPILTATLIRSLLTWRLTESSPQTSRRC